MSKYPTNSILVVDDDRSLLQTLHSLLSPNHHVVLAADGAQAWTILDSQNFELIILDIILPDINGLELLKRIKSRFSETDVVMLTSLNDVKHAVTAMQAGAYHYLTKDFLPTELLLTIDKIRQKRSLNRTVVTLRSEIEVMHNKEMILGSSNACRQIRELLVQVADLPSTVLIQGESGTGKELIARAIHRYSKNHDSPFVTVNLSAIPKHLAESELFGHEKGAFTGAVAQRIGKIELAEGGILFLDEIGDIDPEVQVKLLRFLQEGEFERVGSNRLMRAHTRIIAATNRDLSKAMAENRFRKDLYYRLNVIPVQLPPLRNRQDDIPALTQLFLERYSRRFARAPLQLTSQALSALKHYAWPGNIRELEHLIERLVATHDKNIIDIQDVPLEYIIHNLNSYEDEEGTIEQGFYRKATSLFEKNLIHKALLKTGGNRKKTAEQLGIPLSTLKFKMHKLEINGNKGRL